MVFTLARETKWPRDFILWHLHISEVFQYRHCALRAAGKWTVKPAPPVQDQFDQLFEGWKPTQ